MLKSFAVFCIPSVSVHFENTSLALQWKCWLRMQGVCTTVNLKVSWNESEYLEESWWYFL